jgi:hypothetical protein
LKIPEILGGSSGIFIYLGDTILITSTRADQNLVLTRNLNGDTVSQFFLDGGNGGLLSVINIDPSGNYFLGTHRGGSYGVLKCSPTGNVLATWDSTVSRYMKFNVIFGMTTDFAGRVYIDDAGNSRILVFSNNGTFIGQLETFLNTKKWQGTDYDTSQHRALFINSAGDICLLESYIFSKLFIYRLPH